jgi:hypothetical protein
VAPVNGIPGGDITGRAAFVRRQGDGPTEADRAAGEQAVTAASGPQAFPVAGLDAAHAAGPQALPCAGPQQAPTAGQQEAAAGQGVAPTGNRPPGPTVPPGDTQAGPEPDLVLTVGGTLTPAPAGPSPAETTGPESTGPETASPEAGGPEAGGPEAGGPEAGGAAVPAPAAGEPAGAAPAGAADPAAGAGPATVIPGPAAAPQDPVPAIPARRDGSLFVRHVLSYTAERAGSQVAMLHAGCATSASDLAAARLRAEGQEITVSLVDDDQPVTRAATTGLARCTLGDLRSVPLPPRCYDIVQCTFLLDRVRHAELVLDRVVGAIKPGGLLLLGIRDRDCAAGFLDRVLPRLLRLPVWRKRQAGEPGPHPAVYEALSSERGVQAYALLRGLVIVERRPLGGAAGGLPRGPFGYRAVLRLVARLSGGRLTAAHEELLYVLRKPENRFARVL